MADAAVQPATKHPGDRLASYFENFFKTIVGIATVGASITFAKIVQSPVVPFKYYGFSVRAVQYLLATSWLLFVLALAFTSFFASALSLWRPQAVAAFKTASGKERAKVLWFASAVSAMLFGFVVSAFMTLALVVVAYAGPVGWVAVAFTSVFAALGFASIVWQSPLEWPSWLLVLHEEECDAREKDYQQSSSQGGRRQDDSDLRRNESMQPRGKLPVGRNDVVDGYGRSARDNNIEDNWCSSRKDDRYHANRYSKASTIVSDVHESGRFGQRGMMLYDDGVREGIVIGRPIT